MTPTSDHPRTVEPTGSELPVALTVANSLSRRWTLKRVSAMLQKQGAQPELVLVALREAPLRPHVPPGADDVFQNAAVENE